MNRVELESKRLENFHKLDWQQFRPKYNALEIDIGNSIEHETAKFLGVWLIRKGVPTDLLQSSFKWDKLTEGEVDWKSVPVEEFAQLTKNLGHKFKHEWERPIVITEARFKEFEKINNKEIEKYLETRNIKDIIKENVKPIQRRADIFILDTGECIEIETNHKIKKEDSIVVYI